MKLALVSKFNDPRSNKEIKIVLNWSCFPHFLVTDLIEPFGGYKTTATWSEKDFDLTSTVLNFLRRNAAPLFDLTLDIDPKDPSKYALIVELPRPTSLLPNLLQPLSRQEDVLLVSVIIQVISLFLLMYLHRIFPFINYYDRVTNWTRSSLKFPILHFPWTRVILTH